MLVTWSQVGPWNSVDCQPSLLGKFEASERSCLQKEIKNEKVAAGGMTSKLSSGFYTQTHICAQASVHTHKHAYTCAHTN